MNTATNTYFEIEPLRMTREAYKKLLDQYGFDVVASGVSFDRLMYPDSVKMLIENLKFFGAEFAVCYWIPHPGDDFGMTEMDKAVNVFNKAGQQFAEAGISFVYHPHGYEFRAYNGPGTLFDYMLTKTDPRYVNFQMDVFWIRNPGQNPAALMRKYPGRFPLTHLKDRMHGSVDNQNGRQDPQRNCALRVVAWSRPILASTMALGANLFELVSSSRWCAS